MALAWLIMGVALYLLHDSLDSLARLLVGDNFQHLDLWNTLTQSDPLNTNWSWNPVLRFCLFFSDVNIFFQNRFERLLSWSSCCLCLYLVFAGATGRCANFVIPSCAIVLLHYKLNAAVNRTATTYRLDGR